jgi:putative transferase (TIGR04331 family)
VQHGGSYGEGNATRNLWAESEARVSDVFASWGWGEGEPGIRPLPAPRLMGVPDEAAPSSPPAEGDLEGDEVLVVSNRLRYFVVPERFFGLAPAPEAQERFFRHLDPALLPRVHYRAHPRDGGTLEEQVPWHPRFPQVVLAPLEVAIERQCMQARLVVVNYLFSTTFLQCLAMDLPVMLVVDGGIPYLHPRARALYGALHQVGVVHTRAESAARLVSDIYGDVAGWWREPARRAAVDAFRHAFARSGADAVEQWQCFLREQAALAAPARPG